MSERVSIDFFFLNSAIIFKEYLTNVYENASMKFHPDNYSESNSSKKSLYVCGAKKEWVYIILFDAVTSCIIGSFQPTIALKDSAFLSQMCW
jgi:hypothetical protein